MLEGLRSQIYQVADLEAAKAWYTNLLGKPPYFDEPFYVGFSVGGYELGLQPGGDPDAEQAKDAATYWGVPDAEAAHARLLSLGATEYQPVQDVGGGIKLGAVRDPQGGILGVIENPQFVAASTGTEPDWTVPELKVEYELSEDGHVRYHLTVSAYIDEFQYKYQVQASSQSAKMSVTEYVSGCLIEGISRGLG